MSKKLSNPLICSIFLKIIFAVAFMDCCFSAPVNPSGNAYTHFIEDLKLHNCAIPSQVRLPFNLTKEQEAVDNFDYLSAYLKICQNTESAIRSKEAIVLCNEIFSNVKNISCPATAVVLPDINVALSKQVCPDIGALHISAPEDAKSFLKRLTDSFLCDIMCEGEFVSTCQALLWSYEVRQLIASLQNAKISELPNPPNEVNDNEKLDNFPDKENPNQSDLAPHDEQINGQENNKANDETAHLNEVEDKAPKQPEENTEQQPAKKLVSNIVEKQIPQKEVKDQNVLLQVTNNGQTSDAGSQTYVSPQIGASLQSENTKIDTKLQNQPDNKNIPETNKDHVDNELPHLKGDNEPPHIKVVNELAHLKVDNELPHLKVDNELPHLKVNNEIPRLNPEPWNLNKKDTPNNEFPIHQEKDAKSIDAPGDLQNNEKEISNISDVETNQQSQINMEDKTLVKTEAAVDGAATVNKGTSKNDTTVIAAQTKSSSLETQRQENAAVATDNKIAGQTKNEMITHGSNTNTETEIPQPDNPKQAEEFDNAIPVSEKVGLEITSNNPAALPKTSDLKPDVSSVIPSSPNPSPVPTETAVALEKMEGDGDLPRPSEKDQYNDLDNEGEDEEYSRPDYDGGLYEPAKNKDPNPEAVNVPSAVNVPREVINNQNEKPFQFPGRDVYGRGSNDIQMIAAFPDQEDSHFFFYFLSIVLILMAGYLIFHNKQKIIALIVEGRHERRRRSHGAGYKKLETK